MLTSATRTYLLACLLVVACAPARPGPAALDLARREYTVLVLLDGVPMLLEEAARSEPGGFETLGAIVAAGVPLAAVDDALRREPDAAPLRPMWREARVASAQLASLLTRLSNDDLPLDALPAELAPIHAATSRLLDEAEAALGREYGMDRADLRQLREATLSDLRAP